MAGARGLSLPTLDACAQRAAQDVAAAEARTLDLQDFIVETNTWLCPERRGYVAAQPIALQGPVVGWRMEANLHSVSFVDACELRDVLEEYLRDQLVPRIEKHVADVWQAKKAVRELEAVRRRKLRPRRKRKSTKW